MVAWGEPLEPAVSAVWIVISAGASLVALVVVLALCTCQDKPKEEKTDTQQEVVKRKSKTNNSEAKAEPQIALTDVKIEEDEGNRQSNGAVPAADQTSNGRPRSSDRALPAIPPFRGAAQNETEEEDNDPNYDVIVKASRESAQRPVSKTAKATAPPAKHHAYEKVSERNRYEKVKDQNPYEMVPEKEGAAAAAVPENEYAGPRSEGSDYYAEVKGDTGAEYSQINTSKRNSVKMSMTPTTPTANTKEEDDYVQRPPVPRKNFEQNQAAANGEMMPPIPGPSQPQRSPDLPPRNMPLPGLTSPVAGAMMPANVQAGATTGAVSTAVDAGPQPAPPAQPAGPTGKAEPSYSKVTARESLAHMRERQAQSGQRDDTMYDYIKYEGAEAAPSNQLAPVQEANRGSMTSDLYAEISTAGGGSQRNSMYARIGDAKAAPVPPSVDILKQLDQMDDGAEPGYSSVGAKRSATAAVSKTPNGGKETDPYSKVDHSKKRQTIHIDSNIENKVGAPATELGEMYAKVTKVKTTNAEPAASTNGASSVGGARIKVVEGEGSATGSIEPGYARIRDGAVDANGYQTVEINRRSTGGVTVSIDPGYQTVDIGNMRNSGSEFDPNYEMVTTTQENGIMVGVQPPNPNWQPLKRDPVYQEIPEVKQGSQNSPKK